MQELYLSNICCICGRRISKIKCTCGFDASKNYECYRTLDTIGNKVISNYKRHKKNEDKIIDAALKKAAANPVKEEKPRQACEAVNTNHTNINKTINSSINSSINSQISSAPQFTEKDDGTRECEVGLKFFYGMGVPKNNAVAREYFVKAAKKGNAKAMNYIGDMYYFGEGIEQNVNKAKVMYERAADMGNESAKNNLVKRFKK